MQNLTVAIVIIICTLLLISSLTKLVSHYIKIPFTVLLVLAGMVMSALTQHYQDIFGQLANYQGYPDILLYVCLPTLIFEAAFAMDGRLLRQNLLPILALAVPGLFISTTIIGALVCLFTPLSFLTALLLGSILSATDNVAVIAIFRQVGVPKRLQILVEGESLFNSSTGFVVLKTILFVMLASQFSTTSLIADSIYVFCWQFFGGIIVGLVCSIIIGYFILWMEVERLIVISLTLILAYLSFVLSEMVFGVSGVMAAITAGVMMAYWRKTRFNAETEKYTSNMLEFFVFIVNSLIFLMVGFSISLTVLLHSLPTVMLVICIMLFARAVMVFGLIPLLAKIPDFIPINWRYQTITWWGGIQGAIGLTMVLSLGDRVPHHELLVSIVMGVVLFTIIVQGSTMAKLIHWLKLDKLSLSERFAKLSAEISAEIQTLERIHALQRGGLFSMAIANNLQSACERRIDANHQQLLRMEETRLSDKKEMHLLFLYCLAKEKYLFYQMFSKGTLSVQAYRVLNQIVDMEMDSMRFQGRILKYTHSLTLSDFSNYEIKFIEKIPLLSKLANRLRIHYSIVDYEEKWGAYQSCLAVLQHLKQLPMKIKENTVNEVRTIYQGWMQALGSYLDNVANQFPEFVNDMQKRLATRNLLYAKVESITEQASQGLLTPAVFDALSKKYLLQMKQLANEHPEKMKFDQMTLLRQVPIFQGLSLEDLAVIQPLLTEYHALPNEIIIRQGDVGDTMYLIARGVIRVIKETDGQNHEVATLFAGDFIGEVALLQHIKRTATCKAVTPCLLYVLTRQDFDKLVQQYPAIQEAIVRESLRHS